MRVSCWHLGQNKQSLQRTLPVADRAFRLRGACPEEIIIRCRDRLERSQQKRRQGTINRRASLGSVQKQLAVCDSVARESHGVRDAKPAVAQQKNEGPETHCIQL